MSDNYKKLIKELEKALLKKENLDYVVDRLQESYTQVPVVSEHIISDYLIDIPEMKLLLLGLNKKKCEL